MDFADELMGYEDFKKNRPVVDCLRRAIQAMVKLGSEVANCEGPRGRAAEKPDQESVPKSAPVAEFVRERSQSIAPNQPVIEIWPDVINELPDILDVVHSDALFPTGEHLDGRVLNQVPGFGRPNQEFYSPKIPPPFFGNGWLPYQGGFVDMTPPFDGIYVPADSFSFRLVERTLATTFSVLYRDEQVVNDQTKDMFRYTLQTKNRDRILTHVRWMLGPGRHRVFRAVDIPAAKVAEFLWRGQADLAECDGDGEGIFRTESYAEGLAKGALPPAMLSAMEVQRKLEQLGAREVGNDTLELTLPGSGDHGGSLDLRTEGDHLLNQQPMADTTTIRLSVSMLIHNLSLTATCLQVGPGYRSNELYGAVEASVIPTPPGGAAQAPWPSSAGTLT